MGTAPKARRGSPIERLPRASCTGATPSLHYGAVNSKRPSSAAPGGLPPIGPHPAVGRSNAPTRWASCAAGLLLQLARSGTRRQAVIPQQWKRWTLILGVQGGWPGGDIGPNPLLPTRGLLGTSLAKRLDRRIRVSESQLPNPDPNARLYFEVETAADVDPLTIRDAVTETLGGTRSGRVPRPGDCCHGRALL